MLCQLLAGSSLSEVMEPSSSIDAVSVIAWFYSVRSRFLKTAVKSLTETVWESNMEFPLCFSGAVLVSQSYVGDMISN